MKPEVVEGARNLRAILTSDARPVLLLGLNLRQEELVLRLCNDVMDADLEVKGLEERLRHTVDYSVSLKQANTDVSMLRTMVQTVRNELGREKEISAELSAQVAALRARDVIVAPQMATRFDQPQAFTPLADALSKSRFKRLAVQKKAKR